MQESDRRARKGEASGPPEEVPWGLFQGVSVLVLMLVAQMAANVVFRPQQSGLAGLAGMYVSSAVVVLAAAWHMVARRTDRAAFHSMGLVPAGLHRWLRAAGPVLLGGVALVAVHPLWTFFLEQIGVDVSALQPQDIARMLQAEQSEATFVLGVAVVVVAAPVLEEVVFRSMLYLPLRAALGVLPAAAIVTVLFTTLHFHLLGLAQLAVVGVVLVVVFERTGTLWAPIALHGLYNALQLVLLRYVGLLNGWQAVR